MDYRKKELPKNLSRNWIRASRYRCCIDITFVFLPETERGILQLI